MFPLNNTYSAQPKDSSLLLGQAKTIYELLISVSIYCTTSRVVEKSSGQYTRENPAHIVQTAFKFLIPYIGWVI